ncbi:MAG: hypothetical protein AAF942_10490 [Pseudomonadota bacterium]
MNKAALRDRFGAVLAGGVAYSHERTRLSLDELARLEVDAASGASTVVLSLFEFWKRRQTGGTAPPPAFDPKDAFTPDELRWVSWVDVHHSDPMDYVFRAHPRFLLGDWTGKALRDYPNTRHANSLALEYLTCKMIRQPSYYRIRQTVGDVSRCYMRLLLPVQTRSGPVTRLYYATRYVSIDAERAVELPPRS